MRRPLYAALTATPQRGPQAKARHLVTILAVFALACGLVVVAEGTARANPPDIHTVATWNMQYGPSRWRAAYNLSRHHDVVALQEVPLGNPPFGPGPSAGGYLRTLPHINGVEHHLWRPSRRDPEVHLYILRQASRNIGMITTWAADDVFAIDSVYRDALGVVRNADQVLFASVHAASGGGSDVGALVRRVAARAAQNPFVRHWATIGDFNRLPTTLGQVGLPAGSQIYNPRHPTHRLGGELDYMITNIVTDNWGNPQVLENTDSDHWPVHFGRFRAGADPVNLFTMPLGDSITHGHNASEPTVNGYRLELHNGLSIHTELLKRDALNFVGSQRSGQMTDPDHEGYPDHEIDQIAARVAATVPQMKPNVVTLMAGSTDMKNNTHVAGASDRLGRLVDQILRDAPHATVLVATLPPASDPAVQARIETFNQRVPGMVMERQTAGKHVALVSMSDLTTTDLADGFHPNEAGYRKIANAFANGVIGAVLSGWLESGTAATPQPLRPMALGSSTTWGEGSSHGNGYRATADRGFTDLSDGHVDWVGSVRRGTMADRENEGWPGFRINEIAGKAKCSVTTYQPNLITLLAGGNDVIQNHQMDAAITRLETLIEQVSTDAPGAAVLVAGIQPLHDPAEDARGKAFTAQIPALVDRLVAHGLRVVYADTTGLGPSDISSDGIHPTDQGYDKLGMAFVRAAGEAKNRGWIQRPNSPAENADSDPCDIKDDGPGTSSPHPYDLGPNWQDRGVIQAQQFPSSSRFWMIDVNKDRKAEFVAVDKDQNFRFWWNGGPSGANWVPFVEGQNAYTPAPGAVGNMLRFGDVDGDGFPDCMVVHLDGRVKLSTWKAENPSGSRMCMQELGVPPADVFSNGHEGERLVIGPSTKIRFADVTGGGREDYLLIQPDGTTTAWYNQGLQFQGPTMRYWQWDHPKRISGPLANPREIRYADINGDRRADRILITAKGGARAWINEGAVGAGGTYRDIGKIAEESGLPPKDIQFADLDGDSRDDLVRIGWTGVTRAFLNKLPANYFDTFHP
ncbi:GDSL-type esterase/lipase family protein [Nonomuraea longicatena]|uniref:SGNH hydrolase-type esterase domain-containing protein n=1 Tax=Nonomuraea longicatena TaxID=83682 RepID=A0ABP4BWE8_9ACTN